MILGVAQIFFPLFCTSRWCIRVWLQKEKDHPPFLPCSCPSLQTPVRPKIRTFYWTVQSILTTKRHFYHFLIKAHCFSLELPCPCFLSLKMLFRISFLKLIFFPLHFNSQCRNRWGTHILSTWITLLSRLAHLTYPF